MSAELVCRLDNVVRYVSLNALPRLFPGNVGGKMVRTSKWTQQMSPNASLAEEDLFAVLGVNKLATEVEV
jgi:hypothetical protein